MSNKNKNLAKLSAGATTPAASPETDTAPGESGPVFLIYNGRAGTEGEFAHHGHITFHAAKASGMGKLWPGLNILTEAEAADWPANREHPPIAALMVPGGEHGAQLVVTTPELTGYIGQGLRGLAARSKQPAALEFILERERAKPINATRLKRRDTELVQSLERRLEGARNRPQLSVSDIPKAANTIAQGATARS